jgi:nitrogen fixation protein NifZ
MPIRACVREIDGPPAFEPGDRVRSRVAVRNDGTFRGRPIGAFLVDAGDVGYVRSVGEYLLRWYIYDVDFYERAMIVGMRASELEKVEV